MRRSRRYRLSDLKIFNCIRSVFVGIGAMILCLIGFSAIMTHFSAPDSIVAMMANISLCAGCCVAGYTAAKKKRKNGLVTGIYTGAVIYCIIYFFGVIIFGNFASLSSFGKLLLAAIFSAFGGVLGVNTKIRRPPS